MSAFVLKSGMLMPDQSHDLTLIIPVLNRYQETYKCLSSIRAQVGSASVVLIDNGSIDGSSDRVRDDFPEVRVITNRQNLGVTTAWNQGLAVANTTYVGIVNNDVAFSMGCIEKLLNPLQNYEWVGATSPLTFQSFHEKDPLYTKASSPEHLRDHGARNRAFLGFTGWCFFFRRADFKHGFNPGTRLWYQDDDFLATIMLNMQTHKPFEFPLPGKVPVVVAEAVIVHTRSSSMNQVSFKALRLILDRRAYNRKWKNPLAQQMLREIDWGMPIPLL